MITVLNKEENDTVLFVAKDGKTTIGSARMRLTLNEYMYMPEADIYQIKYTNNFVKSLLMRAALLFALNRGIKTASLSYNNPENPEFVSTEKFLSPQCKKPKDN